MTSTDAAFAGSIPALYDRCLGPLLFEPYAEDLAERVEALRPKRILETAAGTGIVTERLARLLPDSEILATDLNQAMIDVAVNRAANGNVRFQAVDAQSLPFGDESFDAVVTQFGVMFYPDRIEAYREALRVLRPGGHFLFNVWDRIEENPGSLAVAEAVADLFPNDPPAFLQRTPFGYHDVARVKEDLRSAGFTRIEVETVKKRSRGQACDLAEGLCMGSPLRSEIESRDESRLIGAVEDSVRRLVRFEGEDGFDAALSAHVFTAS